MTLSAIKLLSDSVINQIAAGEVVDRPASIIKELIENSIDAKATSISIDIKAAGKELISIRDNGEGISAADISMAALRHATSKIKSSADLAAISSLGFRGEALAAISAVSEMEIVSADSQAGHGQRLRLAAGEQISLEQVNCEQGTRISVKNLFYNTPARRKFLKSDAAEQAQIQKMLLRLFFCYPEVRFQFNNNKNISTYPAESMGQRLGRLVPIDIFNNLIPISKVEGAYKITGFISAPKSATRRRLYQWFMINRRNVNSLPLQLAVMRGYQGQLMGHLYPHFFISIELDPHFVDVNIHPKKAEVKLAEESFLCTLIAEVVRETVHKDARSALNTSSTSKDTPEVEEVADNKSSAEKLLEPAAESYTERLLPKNNLVSLQQPLQFLAKPSTDIESPLVNNSNNIFSGALDQEQENSWRVLGQFDKFFIACSGSDLLIVDTHAAHERVQFEIISKDFHNSEVSQLKLLQPVIMKLAAYELYVLEQHKEQWSKLGFEFRIIDSDELAIIGVPKILQSTLKSTPLERIIREVLSDLADFDKSSSLDKYYHHMIANLACHSAVRGAHKLNLQELNHILQSLVQLDIDLYCPHGRPVFQKISINALERMFKRVL